MVSIKGGGLGKRVIAQLPDQIERKLLRGAARAGATVISDEAKARLGSRQAEIDGGGKVALAGTIKIKISKTPTGVVAKVRPEGPGSYVLPWLEYGTAPHVISASDRARQGKSIGRINRLAKEEGSSHSLVIGGKFVGEVVNHPGAKPHPFLHVSFDLKRDEAIAMAQSFINSRISPAGITGSDEPEGEDA